MRNRILLLVIAILVIAAAFWYFRSGGRPSTAIALVDLYPQAEKRSTAPIDEAYSLRDVTIGGETKRSIYMHPTSRLTFKDVTVPQDAWLRVWVALLPEAWDKEGDGVYFRFGVSDKRTYDELVRQNVDPKNNTNDRRWIPITVDLSQYGGLTVDLIFNTNSSLPGRGDNPANDWGVWGAPEIYVQR